MLDTYHDIESRIAVVILELRISENPNVVTVAQQFSIPAKRVIN